MIIFTCAIIGLGLALISAAIVGMVCIRKPIISEADQSAFEPK